MTDQTGILIGKGDNPVYLDPRYANRHGLIAGATGTGKTVAFGVPLLMKVDPAIDQIQGLIVAPTRELAKQIGKELFRFTKF
ncbi:MAG: helicase HerA-like domain-containing protein, partial [Pseudomonadota bacterium]